MRPRRSLAGYALVCALTVAVDAGHARSPDQAAWPPMTYETFARLSPDDRLKYWNQTTPEDRSQLAQAHATAWLQSNEKRLSRSEASDVRAIIALLTPEHYSAQKSDALKARSAEVDRKIFCTLWKSDVVIAFSPVGRTPAAISWPDKLASWVRNCYF